MPQPPLMAWPMRSNFGGVAFGDGCSQRFDSPGKIGNDGEIDLPHRGLGHNFAQLGENLDADDRIIGIEQRRNGRWLAPLEEFLEGAGIEGLQQEAVRVSGNFTRQVAAADDVDGSLAAGTDQAASGKPIEISTDGAVRQGGQSLGQMQVVTFKSTDSLTKVGSICFRNSDPKNPPVKAANVEVQQGKLESSNVPVAEAAMRLVGVMRQFEMLQKAIGVSSDMDTKTIQEVARVGS